jgi:methylated-DNA-[protein]-cysteine S-methyltransferase
VTQLAWGSLETPVGRLSAGCSAGGVAKLRYGDPPQDAAQLAPAGPAGVLLAATLAELGEYFAGHRKEFTVPVDLSATSGIRHTVLSVLHESVGFGRTLTYGGLAASAGLTDGGPLPPARVVGQFMASNPVAIIVPCHRVVAGTGLGGYSGGAGTEIKQWLLIFEGALPATLDWDPAGVPCAQPAGPA